MSNCRFSLIAFWKNSHLHSVFNMASNIAFHSTFIFFYIPPNKCNIFPVGSIIFKLFGQLLDLVKNEVTRVLMTVKIESNEQIEQAAIALESRAENVQNVTYTAPDESGQAVTTADESTVSMPIPTVGRNEPCPCGSGKKFKFCHGKLS